MAYLERNSSVILEFFFCGLFMSWPCRTGFVGGFCVEFIWPYPIESYIREYVFFTLLCRIWKLPSQ